MISPRAGGGAQRAPQVEPAPRRRGPAARASGSAAGARAQRRAQLARRSVARVGVVACACWRRSWTLACGRCPRRAASGCSSPVACSAAAPAVSPSSLGARPARRSAARSTWRTPRRRRGESRARVTQRHPRAASRAASMSARRVVAQRGQEVDAASSGIGARTSAEEPVERARQQPAAPRACSSTRLGVLLLLEQQAERAAQRHRPRRALRRRAPARACAHSIVSAMPGRLDQLQRRARRSTAATSDAAAVLDQPGHAARR